ncbi:MAG: SemiSWEET family transporter [bacterium]|nr:SemiSWEET family transporter [bacterium]
MIGFHHLRSRALVTQGLEPFPAQSFWKRFLDHLMYVVSVLAPFALLPQIISIYANGDKQGVSVLTWSLLTVFNMLWTIYGVVHKDKLIIIAHTLFTILNGSIVVGVLIY